MWLGRCPALTQKKRQIKKILTANIDVELDKLDSNQNYWIVLTKDKVDFKSLVYDTKPTLIKILSGLWDGDFCIVDKKYNWLTYFKRNNTNTEIFRSGDFETRSDKK